MKVLMMGLMVFSCAVTAWGEIFQMDRKDDSIVEVQKSFDEYRVTCMFKPQTKFDKAINAKFNDAKGDSLCKKGLARYLKVDTNESFTVAGLYSAAPVKMVGERLCYSFGVPISGCKVLKADAKPKTTVVPKKLAIIDSETPKDTTNVVANTSSYLCVVKYKEINGERKTISHREYRGRNFKSPKEFERFCQEELARIRAQGEANLRAVRNFGK